MAVESSASSSSSGSVSESSDRGGDAAGSRISSIRRRLSASVDIAPLVYIRVVFGAALFWEVCRFFEHGWIDQYYVEPVFFFKYIGFEWVSPWPGFGMDLHFAILGLLAVYMMLGLLYRMTSILFCLGFTYVFLLDQTNYLNHFYLICLISLIMACLPAHRSFSLDVWRRPELKMRTIPVWNLWLLRFQLSVPYVYGGIAKLNTDWLHGEPMRTWLAERTDFPLVGMYFSEEWVVYAFSYGGLLFDLLIVPLLLIPRTRVFGFLWLIAFHMLNMTLFSIGIFPWFMVLTAPAFLPADWIQRCTARFRPDVEFSLRTVHVAGPVPQPSGPLRILVVFIVFQLLFPLRHFLYPGDPNWTEEGHRFAWHMKLRTKDSDAQFRLIDKRTGDTQIVFPEDYLTDRQVRKMSGRPDMLLQFSHFLRDECMAKQNRNVEVYADVFSALNGRLPTPLVDTSVDLASRQRTLRPVDWVLKENLTVSAGLR